MTKSSKLASELIAATGLCCLRISVLAGHPRYSKVAIGGIADRDSKGRRIWFMSTKAAERVVAELYRTHGMRRAGALVVDAVPDEADRMLRASARLIGVAMLDDEQVDSKLAILTKRTEAAIKGMGRQGTLKRLRPATEHDDMTRLLARL